MVAPCWGFFPARSYLDRVPRSHHFFPPLSGTFNYGWDTIFRHGPGDSEPVASDLWKRLSIATSSVAVLGIVFGVWLLTRPEIPLLVSRFELTLPEDLESYVDDDVSLLVSPDGSQIVFLGISGDGVRQLWRRPLDQLSALPIPGTEAASSPTFSPDGQSVAFIADGSLRTVSLSGRPPVNLPSQPPLPWGGTSWGSEGSLYYSIGPGIWRASAEGGEQEEVTSLGPQENQHVWPHALPDERGILFTRRGAGEAEIAVLSLETGEINPLLPGTVARYADSGHIIYSSIEGTLFAAPFDLDRLEVTGPSRAVLEGLLLNPVGAASFDVSETGVLAYRSGPGGGGEGIPVWLGRDGSEEVLDPALSRGFRSDGHIPRRSQGGLRPDLGYNERHMDLRP